MGPPPLPPPPPIPLPPFNPHDPSNGWDGCLEEKVGQNLCVKFGQIWNFCTLFNRFLAKTKLYFAKFVKCKKDVLVQTLGLRKEGERERGNRKLRKRKRGQRQDRKDERNVGKKCSYKDDTEKRDTIAAVCKMQWQNSSSSLRLTVVFLKMGTFF